MNWFEKQEQDRQQERAVMEGRVRTVHPIQRVLHRCVEVVWFAGTMMVLCVVLAGCWVDRKLMEWEES